MLGLLTLLGCRIENFELTGDRDKDELQKKLFVVASRSFFCLFCCVSLD